MIQDDVIWQVIGGKGQCSFKTKTQHTVFCTNEMNLTGICVRKFCPLANSRYATVLYRNGKVVLCMKTIERAHTPNRLWEKVELDKNYLKALEKIDSELEYWPKLYIHKCKQRLTKIFQMVRRMRKLKKQTGEKLVVINKKLEQREQMREIRASRSVALNQNIAQELQFRLKERIKSGNIYNENGELFQELITREKKEAQKAKRRKNQEVELELEEEKEGEDSRIFEADFQSSEQEEEEEEELNTEDEAELEEQGFFEQMAGFKDIEELQKGYEFSSESQAEEKMIEYETEEVASRGAKKLATR